MSNKKQIKKQFIKDKKHTNSCIYEHAQAVSKGIIRPYNILFNKKVYKGVWCAWKECAKLNVKVGK